VKREIRVTHVHSYFFVRDDCALKLSRSKIWVTIKTLLCPKTQQEHDFGNNKSIIVPENEAAKKMGNNQTHFRDRHN
jgi:hypothetical protein